MIWKYYVLRLAYLLLGRLSLRSLYGFANVVGTGAYFVRRNARRAVIANMRRVMGPDASEREVRRTALEVFRNAARYYADLLHIPHLDVARFRAEQLELEGIEYLREAEQSGRGGIVVSAHFGNPEMVVQGVAADGFSLYGLTEPLQPEKLSEFVNWLRSQHGHRALPVSFGAIKEALLRLKRGGLIAILLDRDVGGTGVPMQFFGAEARIPLGAVDLALRTGSDLIPAWGWRIKGFRFRGRIGPPLELIRTGDVEQDILTNTQRLLALFEDVLRADPGQWAVLEAIWPSQDNESATTSIAVQ